MNTFEICWRMFLRFLLCTIGFQAATVFILLIIENWVRKWQGTILQAPLINYLKCRVSIIRYFVQPGGYPYGRAQNKNFNPGLKKVRALAFIWEKTVKYLRLCLTHFFRHEVKGQSDDPIEERGR